MYRIRNYMKGSLPTGEDLVFFGNVVPNTVFRTNGAAVIQQNFEVDDRGIDEAVRMRGRPVERRIHDQAMRPSHHRGPGAGANAPARPAAGDEAEHPNGPDVGGADLNAEPAPAAI
jgi:phage tail tape-measure protein